MNETLMLPLPGEISRIMAGSAGIALLVATISARQRPPPNVPHPPCVVKLLSISTSTPHGTVAVLDGDRLLASTSYDDLAGHAEKLFGLVDQALSAAGLNRRDLEAIACDVGPGSFTGVRVGVASVKGMALALGVPVVGVMSLEAMAARAFAEGRARTDDVVGVSLDAKKGEVFLALFDASLTPLLEAAHIARPLAHETLVRATSGRSFILIGEPLVAQPLSTGAPSDPARSPDASAPVLPPPELPEAAWIGRVAMARLMTGGGVDPAVLEPLYVRPPDAKPARTSGG
jgi:tRNA threonylcarbamoyladenosine biosynthesis protein TsaB